MKNKLIIFAIALSISALPLTSFAASYMYIDKVGAMRFVSAESGSQAIMIAPDIHPRSGVMLIVGTTTIFPTQGVQVR